ncbi:MAG: hypothetical protein UW82_C0013G0011 [candidate division WWE3 bacterium GW2011_GWC2_44_9]|uniref:Uncharacterized protein n=1 Tax=candidate division WWE3 bacterium GW2011_GWC2_44_9 TaxID=1619125 RepID=A0A0G1NKH8_UNCKA|nr:MAG: hypothetical protein UW82_C0013G0011 [candidate division WWE3 bacterium GW2011_GWC2_44_9]
MLMNTDRVVYRALDGVPVLRELFHTCTIIGLVILVRKGVVAAVDLIVSYQVPK